MKLSFLKLSCLRSWPAFVLGLGLLSCTSEHLCPDSVPGWQERELTLEEMQAIMAPYTGVRARKVEAQGGWCEPTPVGVDSRNGRLLYIRMHCDDVCPDYTQFLLTYGPDIPAGAPCEDDGYCTLYHGATIAPIYCMPYAQGYSQCGSASFCNWNGVCEPGNMETPLVCPAECPCGSVGSGPPTDWLAAGFELPLRPEDASDLAHGHPNPLANTVSRYLTAWQELMGAQDQIEKELMDAVRAGQLSWLLRWEAEPLTTDDYIALRFQCGPPQVREPSLDGTDTLVFAHPFEEGAVLCGRGWYQYDGETGSYGWTNLASLTLPLPGLWRSALPLAEVKVNVSLDVSGLVSARITGAMPLSALESHLLPTLAADLNRRIAAGGAEAARIAAALDGACDPIVCPEVIPGQGECTSSSPPEISVTEIRCNPIFMEAFTPDYDLVRDGVPDGLWFGFRVAPMVPVRLVEP
ncbi:MAG: hypothetical protein RBU30_03925 [Polyangia bacterium]|nr:hypothetical protein [Polyangia bacterium]